MLNRDVEGAGLSAGAAFDEGRLLMRVRSMRSAFSIFAAADASCTGAMSRSTLGTLLRLRGNGKAETTMNFGESARVRYKELSLGQQRR